MECKVSTPSWTKTVKVKEIVIDSGEGVLKIYPQHTDMVSSIKINSNVSLTLNDGRVFNLKCNQGILKIESNKALILIDTDEKDIL